MKFNAVRVDPPYRSTEDVSLFLRELRRAHESGVVDVEDYARRRKAVAARVHFSWEPAPE